MKLQYKSTLIEEEPVDRPYKYAPEFLTKAEADSYFNRIMDELKPKLGPADTYGRKIKGKLDCTSAYSGYRKSLWVGPEISPGRSEARRCSHGPEQREWPPVLEEIKARVEKEVGEEFNSCLVNLYPTGKGGIGRHRDQDDESDWTRSIASVSLGAERRFDIYDIPDGVRVKDVESKLISSAVLHHGSLCVMPAGFQKNYEHAIPVALDIEEPRINLTFRWIADWQKRRTEPMTTGKATESKLPPTIGGYEFHEVVSALQKSIRRGLEKEALFWSHELFLSEPYKPHLWNRLLIIASEDVGLADSNIAVLVHALYETDKRINDKKPAAECNALFITHAVLALVRAPKSRMVDHATICATLTIRHKLGHPTIPDYALDKHTLAGRNMGRWWKHFRKVGAVLVNRSLDDPYEEKCFELLEQHEPMPGYLNGGTETE